MSNIIKTLCPLCWRPEETELEKDKPCMECQAAMKKGFLLIGVDFSRSKDAETAARTGHRWIIPSEDAKKLYKEESFEKGAGLIDIEEAKQYGLPVQVTASMQKARAEAIEAENKPVYTNCVVCGEPIYNGELGGIDPEKGLMHKKCTPLKLIKA